MRDCGIRNDPAMMSPTMNNQTTANRMTNVAHCSGVLFRVKVWNTCLKNPGRSKVIAPVRYTPGFYRDSPIPQFGGIGVRFQRVRSTAPNGCTGTYREVRPGPLAKQGEQRNCERPYRMYGLDSLRSRKRSKMHSKRRATRIKGFRVAMSRISLSYRIGLLLAAAAACLPSMVQAGRDAVPYPQSAPPRIAYIQKVTPGFELRLLDVATGKVQDLLHFINPPEHLSVARRGRVLLVFGDSALHVLDLQTQKQEEISPLPQLTVPKGHSEPESAAAGYLEDGSLAVVMESVYISNLGFYLYQRSADGWKQLDTGGCESYDECPDFGFSHALDARLVDRVSPQLDLRKAVEQNPFFLSRSDRSTGTDPEAGGNDEEHVIVFDFGASRSDLVYDTQPDPDSGPDYISYLSLKVPGQPPRVLCDGQCGAEIMGRYLIAGDVIDLSSGKVLLDTGSSPFDRVMEIGWVY